MPSQLVQLDARFSANPETVFDFFCDHESFGRIWQGEFSRIRASEEPGNPNGVGSAREIRLGLMRFEETHTCCERPRLIEYRVTRGSPIKNHVGRIRFIAEPDGSTRVDYTIEFDPKIPFTGGLIARSLKRDWAQGIGPIIKELSD